MTGKIYMCEAQMSSHIREWLDRGYGFLLMDSLLYGRPFTIDGVEYQLKPSHPLEQGEMVGSKLNS